MPLLQVQSLAKVFSRQGKRVVALENFDLAVEDGEFVAIVGPSGCGKSTFLHMLGGFEPISGGTMKLNGELVASRAPTAACCFRNTRCTRGGPSSATCCGRSKCKSRQMPSVRPSPTVSSTWWAWASFVITTRMNCPAE